MKVFIVQLNDITQESETEFHKTQEGKDLWAPGFSFPCSALIIEKHQRDGSLLSAHPHVQPLSRRGCGSASRHVGTCACC